MANVKFQRKEFEKEIPLTDGIIEKISLFGTPLESITENELEIEIFPNRPDLLSMQNYIRSFKAFIGKGDGIKKYLLKRPEKDYSVNIHPSVISVRPYTTCAIVKNLNLNNEKIKEIIELQEKLHNTIGRKRKKIAIGIYPLEKIKLPITYQAMSPEKIKFIPLGYTIEMDGNQILKKHQTGKEYAHLLANNEKFPVFIDSDKKILSMPPIINSNETGRITENTKEIFIECSGHDFSILKNTLNILVTTFAEMGGKIYQMNLEYQQDNKINPDLTPEKIKLSLENTNKLLGLELKESDLTTLLNMMEYNYSKGTVQVAPWRVDVLHEVDIIEDIAIAYGYNNLTPELPNISTIAEESNKIKIKNKIAEILIGLGLLEISTYHLIKREEADNSLIEVEDSKTEYTFLRPNLLIPALRILSENKDAEYPQRLFEIGTVFYEDTEKKKDTEINEKENLIVAIAPGNFTNIKQVLDYLFKALGLNYELEESIQEKMIEGRTANIKLNNKIIGYIGEVHPKILNDLNIQMPLTVLEISLDEIFNILKHNQF